MGKTAKRSQCDMILQHMKDFGSITTFEAFMDYGCTRLSARIADLRKTHVIKSENEFRENRYGQKVRYSRYSLASEGDLV